MHEGEDRMKSGMMDKEGAPSRKETGPTNSGFFERQRAASLAGTRREPPRRSFFAGRTATWPLCLVLALSLCLPAATASAAADADEDRPAAAANAGRSIAPEAIERMHADAEDAYRARRWSEAMQAFNAIVVLEPNHARAWLRIGNLHHRRNQLLSAASAYRKAAQRATLEERTAARDRAAVAERAAAAGSLLVPNPVDPLDAFAPRGPASREAASSSAARSDHTRAKALINLAMVNVELARSALAEIGKVPPELVGARDEAAASLRRTRGDVDRRRRRDSPAWRDTHPASAHSSKSQRPAAPDVGDPDEAPKP